MPAPSALVTIPPGETPLRVAATEAAAANDHPLMRERAALARELHDDVGNTLAALRLDALWIARHAAEPAVRLRAEAAAEAAQSAIDATRRMVGALQPVTLHDGLLPALERLAHEFARRTGAGARVLAAGEPRGLSHAVTLAAYRVAQEGLANAMKHAGCAQVEIEVVDAGGVFTLEVRDDGRGLPAEGGAGAGGHGLRGLAQRAGDLGGWIDIAPRGRPGGTALTLCVPLRGLRQAGEHA